MRFTWKMLVMMVMLGVFVGSDIFTANAYGDQWEGTWHHYGFRIATWGSNYGERTFDVEELNYSFELRKEGDGYRAIRDGEEHSLWVEFEDELGGIGWLSDEVYTEYHRRAVMIEDGVALMVYSEPGLEVGPIENGQLRDVYGDVGVIFLNDSPVDAVDWPGTYQVDELLYETEWSGGFGQMEKDSFDITIAEANGGYEIVGDDPSGGISLHDEGDYLSFVRPLDYTEGRGRLFSTQRGRLYAVYADADFDDNDRLQDVALGAFVTRARDDTEEAEHYSGGDGSAGDPFLIATASDWQELVNSPDDWNSHFEMTNNIDLDGTGISPIGEGHYGDSGFDFDIWEPFTGVFDGQGYVISGVNMGSLDQHCVGLFGLVGEGGHIKNLVLEDIQISGEWSAGALVGLNEGRISNCRVREADVRGFEAIGGLAGSNVPGGVIEDCCVQGLVTGEREDEDVYPMMHGGLVGGLWGGSLMRSCADVDVSTQLFDGYRAGGLAGEIDDGGTLTDCYALGDVSGFERQVGGLVGYIEDGTVTNSYSIGSVSGSEDVGGLIGSIDSGTVTDSFWDVDTSAQTLSAGGTGLPTDEMQTQSTYTDAGWNFDGIWDIDEDYPFLIHEIEEVGRDTSDSDSDSSSSTCFIATAAYGTPMAPEIDVLRALRDEVLCATESGERAVETYYRLSPPVAQAIGQSDTARLAVRQGLRPVIYLSREFFMNDD